MSAFTQGPLSEFQVLLLLAIGTYLVVAPLFVFTVALLGYIGRRAELADKAAAPADPMAVTQYTRPTEAYTYAGAAAAA